MTGMSRFTMKTPEESRTVQEGREQTEELRAGWTWDGLPNMCPAMRYQSQEGLACTSLNPHLAMKLERDQ